MSHYIFLTLFLLIVPFCMKLLLELTNRKIYDKMGFWFCVVFLMFLSAFRGEMIGNDTQEYLRVFQETSQDLTRETRYEIGYVYLNYITSFITSNPQSILILTSVIIFLSFGRFIWKYSKLPWLSLFLFFAYGFFVFSITAIRQSLAIAILLFSYDYILQGKKVKFLLFVLLATTFHSTAIFFIFGYLCRFVKPSIKVVFLFYTIGSVCMFSFYYILNFTFAIFTEYEHYNNGVYFGDTRLASILYVVISSCIYFFSYYILSRKNIVCKISEWQFVNTNNMLGLISFAVLLYFISLKLNILDRIAIYYNVFSIILLPNAICKLGKEYRSIVSLFVILFFFTYSIMIILMRPNWGTIYPFSFCWNNY